MYNGKLVTCQGDSFQIVGASKLVLFSLQFEVFKFCCFSHVFLWMLRQLISTVLPCCKAPHCTMIWFISQYILFIVCIGSLSISVQFHLYNCALSPSQFTILPYLVCKFLHRSHFWIGNMSEVSLTFFVLHSVCCAPCTLTHTLWWGSTVLY